jgi:LysM repeat protein
MDKFGYLKILKQFSKIYDKLEKVDSDITSSTVINIIKNNMNTTTTIDESLSGFRKYFTIASMLVLPGFMSVEALADDLSKIDSNNFYETSDDVQDAIYNSLKDTTLYGGYVASNIINMVARTLYVEGHAEDTKGRKAILSVILNRCNNDRNYIAAVIKQYQAFSCWNAMTDEDWKKFKYKIPTSGKLSILDNPNNEKIWNECEELATQLFNGTFKSTIGNRNAYLNPETASEKAKTTWGKKLDIKIGRHKFGYVSSNDPKYVIPGTFELKSEIKTNTKSNPKVKTTVKTKNKTNSTTANKTKTTTKPIYYNIADGDTLSSISKKYNTTPKNILKLNKTIKNQNKIKIGQKIRVK